VQWTKYQDQVDKVRKQLDTFVKGMDDLSGTRRRALERPLAKLEDLRREQGIELDAPLVEAEPAGTVGLSA
jgi:DNA recombination protein RmuC